MDYSKYSDIEIARGLASNIQIVSELEEQLKLHKSVRKHMEFEFLMRYDKEYREKHKFLLPNK